MRKCRNANCQIKLEWKNLEFCNKCILTFATSNKFQEIYQLQQGCCYYCNSWRPNESVTEISLQQQVSISLLPDCKGYSKTLIPDCEFSRLGCYSCLRTKRLFRTMSNIRVAVSYLLDKKTVDNYSVEKVIQQDVYFTLDLMRKNKRQCHDCYRVFDLHPKRPQSYCKPCQVKHRLDLKDLRKNRTEIIQEHGQQCEICNLFIYQKSRLHLDHDHTTGSYRGLLCSSCNAGLGYARDSVTILQQILERS